MEAVVEQLKEELLRLKRDPLGSTRIGNNNSSPLTEAGRQPYLFLTVSKRMDCFSLSGSPLERPRRVLHEPPGKQHFISWWRELYVTESVDEKLLCGSVRHGGTALGRGPMRTPTQMLL